ncbi:cysteine-rich venom protein-like [Anneissia japonica]|uniref:cysteine-rich venom protein-like n=1 Tax=Anneissia japonica TaxID=1529436 RepID=UPI0014258F66|nr:cysteine-rich venom protein-like [Anneissia japonica]
MLQRYFIPIGLFALCLDCRLGLADKPQVMKSNKSIKVIQAIVDIHSRKRRSTAFTSEQIQAIVDRHNYYRRNVSPGPASNMEYMEWDDNLATMAQLWSNGCYYGHGQPTPNLTPYSSIGQNLYASSNAGTDGVDATDAWNSEDVDYDYNSHTCSDVCGHYTQNVWATSNRIGCGFTFCTNPSGLPWPTANLITCNYGPGCDDDLCRPCADHSGPCVCKATCHNCGNVTNACTCVCHDGWLGADCTKECGNYDDRCGANPGWPVFWCDADHQYVLDGCPLMCGLCVEPDPSFVCKEPSASQCLTPIHNCVTYAFAAIYFVSLIC